VGDGEADGGVSIRSVTSPHPGADLCKVAHTSLHSRPDEKDMDSNEACTLISMCQGWVLNKNTWLEDESEKQQKSDVHKE